MRWAAILAAVLVLYLGHGRLLGKLVSGKEDDASGSVTQVDSVAFSIFDQSWKASGIEIVSREDMSASIMSAESIHLVPFSKDPEAADQREFNYNEIHIKGLEIFANRHSMNAFGALKKKAAESTNLEKFSTRSAIIELNALYIEILIPGIGSRKISFEDPKFTLENIESREDLIVEILEEVIQRAGISTSVFF